MKQIMENEKLSETSKIMKDDIYEIFLHKCEYKKGNLLFGTRKCTYYKRNVTKVERLLSGFRL